MMMFDAQFRTRNGIFADLQALYPVLWQDWPLPAQLQTLLKPEARTHSGHDIQFVAQDDDLAHGDMGYEQRIAHSGIVATREQNWHDLFNALIWANFPRSKAQINQQHLLELAQQEGTKRTRKRDALTQFDESGIVIATSCDDFEGLLSAHEWQRIFVEQREHWGLTTRAYVFGHAIYEIALEPFIGFTGKAMVHKVEAAFFDKPLQEQYDLLDKMTAAGLQGLASPKMLKPLPVLGVPGWWAENADSAFYQNTQYFRPKRVS